MRRQHSCSWLDDLPATRQAYRVALVQRAIIENAPVENRQAIEQMLKESVASDLDLIVLSEMFTTGFITNRMPEVELHYTKNSIKPGEWIDVAEVLSDGETLKWMANLAQRYSAVVVGSILVCERGMIRNRQYYVQPPHKRLRCAQAYEGTSSSARVIWYDKCYLFTPSKEDRLVASSEYSPLTIELSGFRVCPQICYDLRFPEGSRNEMIVARTPLTKSAEEETIYRPKYDLMICSASWPSVRAHAWRAALQMRSVENQCWSIGVNRVGRDPDGTPFSGDSMIVRPDGEIALQIPAGAEQVATLDLFSLYSQDVHLRRYMRSFHILEDAHDFAPSSRSRFS